MFLLLSPASGRAFFIQPTGCVPIQYLSFGSLLFPLGHSSGTAPSLWRGFYFRNVRLQDIFPVQKPAIQRQVWQKPVVQQKLILGSTDFHSEWQLLVRPDVQRPLSVGRESPGTGRSVSQEQAYGRLIGIRTIPAAVGCRGILWNYQGLLLSTIGFAHVAVRISSNTIVQITNGARGGVKR